MEKEDTGRGTDRARPRLDYLQISYLPPFLTNLSHSRDVDFPGLDLRSEKEVRDVSRKDSEPRVQTIFVRTVSSP